jgi:TRAP transporter TAXI family solute receptor
MTRPCTHWLAPYLSAVTMVVAATAASGCRAQPREAPKSTVRFAMPEGSSSLTDALVDLYGKRVSDAIFVRTNTPGTVLGMDYIDEGRAEVTMIPSDIAYIAYAKGTENSPHPHTKLRGMAMLYANAIHLLVSDRVQFRNLDDLRGKTIGVGPKGGNTDFTVRTVLPYLGIPLSDVHLEQLSREGIYNRSVEGTLDAAFIVISYPASSVKNVLKDTGFHVAPIEGPRVSQLRSQYPFLRPIVIPAGVYGTNKIQTIGSNWLLVCREDVSEKIVYRMLGAFMDSIAQLAAVQPALLTVTPQDFALTPIPLHPGAARFYREMELLR